MDAEQADRQTTTGKAKHEGLSREGLSRELPQTVPQRKGNRQIAGKAKHQGLPREQLSRELAQTVPQSKGKLLARP